MGLGEITWLESIDCPRCKKVTQFNVCAFDDVEGEKCLDAMCTECDLEMQQEVRYFWVVNE